MEEKKSNITQEIQELEKKARQGRADAQCELGMYYLTHKQEVRAWVFISAAAVGGDCLAQHVLASNLRSGAILNADPNVLCYESARWYKEAALQGDHIAQLELGYCYSMGLGVKKDPLEAARWYLQAALLGNLKAFFRLSDCCSDESIKSALSPAIEQIPWRYAEIAENGDKHAQYLMGRCYAEGLGVGEDIEKANKWYALSAAQGYEPAIEDFNPPKSHITLFEDKYEKIKEKNNPFEEEMTSLYPNLKNFDNEGGYVPTLTRGPGLAGILKEVVNDNRIVSHIVEYDHVGEEKRVIPEQKPEKLGIADLPGFFSSSSSNPSSSIPSSASSLVSSSSRINSDQTQTPLARTASITLSKQSEVDENKAKTLGAT